MTDQKNLALLPTGFVDLLPPHAEAEATAISSLMQNFASFGYQRVKPPLLEFEDSLFAPGPGALMADNTFRVMDPVSHRMMGVRSDITPQIARISSSRLKSEARPLRVCYANDVLRTKASQQRTERQFTQVGCEIVGEVSLEADIESCVMALIGLHDLGVENVTIDVCYPGLLLTLFKQLKLKPQAIDDLKAAFARKSKEGVPPVLKKLMDCSGLADQALTKMKALKISSIAKNLNELAIVVEAIHDASSQLGFKNVQVTIDPVETRGLHYYAGIGFTLFAKNVPGVLGRGGRYNVHFGSEKPIETACGFTLYMDTVRRAMPAAVPQKIIKVSAQENWAHIRTLQKQGSVVVRHLKKSKGKK